MKKIICIYQQPIMRIRNKHKKIKKIKYQINRQNKWKILPKKQKKTKQTYFILYTYFIQSNLVFTIFIDMIDSCFLICLQLNHHHHHYHHYLLGLIQQVYQEHDYDHNEWYFVMDQMM